MYSGLELFGTKVTAPCSQKGMGLLCPGYYKFKFGFMFPFLKKEKWRFKWKKCGARSTTEWLDVPSKGIKIYHHNHQISLLQWATCIFYLQICSCTKKLYVHVHMG